jgi:type IV secretion system protein VirB6
MQDVTAYLYYRLIYNFLSNKIETFGLAMMGRVAGWVNAVALILVTIWILVQGYRVLTGQMREPLMGLVISMGRIVVIVGAATTMGFAGTDLHTFLTNTLDKQVHQLFTGTENETTSDAIDKNLAWTQLALGAISAVQVVPGDQESQDAKSRAELLAAFGTASPPMAAGAMLLLYQFAIALFIGLGPLFILCLIFEQTKSLFSRWLMYGIGTIFSMALLSVVASMVLDLMIAVNEAIWGAKIANKLLGTDAEGLSTLALQQGGIGLLLTTLIISVPPMAAMFFQGTLGGFSPYSVFSGGAQRPGPQGQPPGSWGGGSLPGVGSSHAPTDRVRENNGFAVRTPSNGFVPQGDVTKRQ